MNNIKKRFLELENELSSNGNLLHVSQLLQRAQTLWTIRIALTCDDEEITYQQLYHTTTILADKLTKLGLKPQDRVLIMYENSINFFKAYHAVWHAQAIVVPLNVYLHEKE